MHLQRRAIFCIVYLIMKEGEDVRTMTYCGTSEQTEGQKHELPKSEGMDVLVPRNERHGTIVRAKGTFMITLNAF